MRMVDIIRKKRDGFALTREEISFFIEGYVKGEIPDYQASALCMAIVFQGMNDDETVMLTDCMAHSGDMVDLSCFREFSVDKHSTGGVGDKTTLIVAPIVASLGGKVAKMSGRGLGHTGGTVDKLEAIPGMKLDLKREAFLSQVEQVGVAVVGQTENLTPADKKLYALRDVTATVDCVPLITSSIMSKKIAAGSRNIVLDVKTGSGAFLKTYDEAKRLAENMVQIGKSCGRRISAVLTDMDTPLGNAIGNSLEVAEAVSVLKGETKGDILEVCLALSAEMIRLFKGISFDEAMSQAIQSVESKEAFKKMKEWISAQGGDVRCIDDPGLFEKAACIAPLISAEEGYIASMNAQSIGEAAAVLGAGRSTKESPIDYAAGIVLSKKTGDFVHRGEVLAYLHTNNKQSVPQAEELYLRSLRFSSEQPPARPLIYDIVR